MALSLQSGLRTNSHLFRRLRMLKKKKVTSLLKVETLLKKQSNLKILPRLQNKGNNMRIGKKGMLLIL